MPRNQRGGGHACFACGRRDHVQGAYCPHCGVEQSEANARHWRVIRDHESAARKAVRKARNDRRLYGLDRPLTELVVTVAEGLARGASDPENDREELFFPAVSGPDEGLCRDLVVDMALDRLESG